MMLHCPVLLGPRDKGRPTLEVNAAMDSATWSVPPGTFGRALAWMHASMLKLVDSIGRELEEVRATGQGL